MRADLAAAAPASEPRGGGFRAVGVAVARLAAPVLAKRGGRHLGRLKTAWPAVIGAAWAEAAWPQRLGRDGALELRVRPAAALELQHRAPLLRDRINLFLGGAVVTRLVLKQALPPRAPMPVTPTRKLTANEADALERRLGAVGDPELRAALALLLGAVLAASPPPKADVASGAQTD